MRCLPCLKSCGSLFKGGAHKTAGTGAFVASEIGRGADHVAGKTGGAVKHAAGKLKGEARARTHDGYA